MKKQTFAWIMTLIMIVSLFSQNAYASELNGAEDSKETSTVTESVSSEQETEGAKEKTDNSSETELPGNDSQTGESSSTESAEESSGESQPAESEPGESSSESEPAPEDSEAEPTQEPTAEPEEDPALLTEMEDPEEIKYADIADGYYTISTKLNANRILDIKSGSRTKGANIQIFAANLTSAQIFKVEGHADGDSGRKYYFIKSYNNLKEALDVTDASNTDGANVQQNDYSASAISQKWYITDEGDGFFAIRSAVSGEELTKALETTANKNGSNVFINTFAGNDSQLWKFNVSRPYEPKTGLYTIHLNGTSKVMDVAGNVGANGTNIDLYKGNGTSAQQFYLKPVGYGGLYSIISVSTRNAVDVDSNKGDVGTNVQTWKYKGVDSQIVRFEGTGAEAEGQPVFNILTKKSTKYGVNGNNVEISDTAAEWYLTNVTGAEAAASTAEGFYYITAKLDSNKAVNIKKSSLDNGAAAQLYTKNTTNAQKFKLSFTSDGYARFQNIQSRKALSVSKGKKENGTKIVQWTFSGSEILKFKIVPTNDGDGSVYLQYSNSNFYVDIPGGNTADGTELQIYKASKANRQKFFLEKTVTKTGWQTYMGGKRYLYDGKGHYYKNTTIDGIELGADGTPKETWVYKDGFWRYRIGNTYVNDVRPYLEKLFGTKTVPRKSLPNFTEPAVSAPKTPGYYVTLDRTRCLVTVYTKYPGTDKWNLPVCAFKCSPGKNDTPTDPGTRWTVANARWSELMGPSYGQYTTRLSKPGQTSKWSGELFHSVPCGSPNDHNVPIYMYNALGKKASHGCVRMDVRNCYWICKFCAKGMMVKVGDNYNAPIKAVPQPKMRSGKVDPTDPAYTKNYGYVDTNVYYGDYYF